MAFKLADLFVQITGDAKPLSSALVLVQQQLMGMSGIGGQLGASITSGIAGPLLGLSSTAATGVGLVAIAGAAATAALAKTAMMAGHLTEAINKSEQVFGSSNHKMVALADELARKFGIVKTAVLDTGASFGLMFEGAGIAREKATDMASAMVRLAADAKSFFDISLDEAITRLASGLAGETEAVRRWGVNLTEANVHQKAVAMGLAKGKGELDQSTKTMVRYQLIMEALKPAQGDLERTGGGLVQQWEKFTGQLINMATAIGTAAMPAFTALLGVVNDVLSYVMPSIEAWAKWTAELWRADGPLRQIGQTVGAIVAPAFKFLHSQLWMIVGTVQTIIKAFVDWFGWLAKISGITSYFAIEDRSDDGNAERQKAIDDRIKASEEQFRADSAAGEAAKKKDKAFRGSLVEYANKLAEAAAGGGKDNLAKQQLSAAKQSNDLLGQIAVAVQKPPQGVAAALAG